MADATKTTARHIGHMTYTQAPAVYEKNIFHLFRFTQPVKNYSSGVDGSILTACCYRGITSAEID